MKDLRLAFALLGIGALAIAFVSPLKVVFGLAGIAAIVATLLRSATALPYLMVLVAIEPFALKWVPDELYVYARYFSELLIYTIAAGVGKELFLKKVRFQFPAAFACIALLAAVAVLSALVNETPAEVALLGMRQIFRFLVLFCCVALLQLERRHIMHLTVTLIALVAFESGLGILQALVGAPLDDFLLPGARKVFGDIQLTAGTDQFWEPGQRVFATMGRYDQLGTFLTFGLLMIGGVLFELKNQESRIKNQGQSLIPASCFLLPASTKAVLSNQILIAILFAFGILTLVLTYSRASWFGFLLGFFLHRRAREEKQKNSCRVCDRRDAVFRLLALLVEYCLAPHGHAAPNYH